MVGSGENGVFRDKGASVATGAEAGEKNVYGGSGR